MDQEDWEEDSCFLPSPLSSKRVISLDVDTFRKDMIAAHNHYRSLHDSPPLEHLQELEETAQDWAETIAAKGHLEYCEKLKNVGESVCVVDLQSSTGLSAKDLVRKWYKEIKAYTFAYPRWRRGAIHFTQMVWKSSKHIGIGIAPVPGEPRLFLVVRYYPAGNSNYPGDFQRNVLPRISLKSTDSFFNDDSSFVRTYSGRFRTISSEDAYL